MERKQTDSKIPETVICLHRESQDVFEVREEQRKEFDYSYVSPYLMPSRYNTERP